MAPRRVIDTTLAIFGAYFLFASEPAHAWGPAGHQIVCAIAWDGLTPNVQSRAKRILHLKTRDQFANLCTWADEYRIWNPQTSGWHYVHVPPGATSVDVERDCSGTAACAIVKIVEEARTLKDHEPGIGRAMTLKFLMHFVGDIHDPLHASYARDDSGVQLRGTFLGRPMSFHAVWDNAILEADGRSVEQLTADLEKEITPADRKNWAAAKPLDWANESLAIALAPSTGYALHGNTFDLGDDYARRNLPIVLRRLKQAGVRLAVTLNDALK
jgi:hypothetical protein